MSKHLQRRHRQLSPLAIAQAEAEQLLQALPEDLRARAQALPLTFESAPTAAMLADGLDPDTLGLFVGEEFPAGASGGAALPAQIILFVGNLWAYAEGDPSRFRREVRKTILHELGHYLGLDEQDLETRRLD